VPLNQIEDMMMKSQDKLLLTMHFEPGASAISAQKRLHFAQE
jgi:hypothetical protein